MPHASILSVEVIQRDDALVLVLTTRSYKRAGVAFSSRSATNARLELVPLRVAVARRR